MERVGKFVAVVLYIFLICSTYFGFAGGIPINNGVVGSPEIECAPHEVGVTFLTQQPFSGRVFVKGFVDEVECVVRGSAVDNSAGITLLFDRCGVRRERQISPAGISIVATVIISFHPTFLTKVDRAYRINCFYMEAVKTVEQEMLVSMLTTAVVTRQLPMPLCKYEILEKNADGNPVKYARIGDPVYHKWTCEADQENIFCMRVHSCTVGDGQGGKRIMVINEEGCAIDRYILQNLVYTGDLSAGQEAHVFKFADKPVLNFNCEIELRLKDRDGSCADSQPKCATIGDQSLLATEEVPSREKRRLANRIVADFDLPEQSFMVFDLPDSSNLGEVPHYLHIIPRLYKGEIIQRACWSV